MLSAWNAIRVPAIRRTVVERLRGVDAARLEADGDGGMCLARPSAPIDPDRGARVVSRIESRLTY